MRARYTPSPAATRATFIIMFASSSNNSSWVNLLNPNSHPSPPPPPDHPFPPASTSHFFPCFNHNNQDPQYDQFLVSNHGNPIDSDHMGFHGSGPALAFFSSSSSSPLPTVARSTKKDRHSKICTARGVRDRRVRLSVGIAREFFDLQDMLGYDKASKTLEWLLNKSKKAIREIARAKKHQIVRSACSAGRHATVPEESNHSKGTSSDLSNFKEDMMEMPQQGVSDVDQVILGKEVAWANAIARIRERPAIEKICCFASPNGVVEVHNQQSTRVHSSSGSRSAGKPCQYQQSSSSTPFDPTQLDAEPIKNDFPLNNLPQNWNTSHNLMILHPSSFALQDSVPYI